jgi:Ni,Fe-hydrogenase I large subunit
MALRVSKTAEVDPISRIEGHLGVKLTTDANGRVSGANVHGNLWRGFENFLIGRDANDAITFTQRICGVCPVPHGMTSTYAADSVMGYSKGHITFADDGTHGVPAKAVLIRNLVLSAEFLMSHLTHFYHLVALDYVQGPDTPPWTPYFANDFYHALLLNPGRASTLPENNGTYSKALWDAVVTQYVKALRIRRLTFEAGALFAGRMPMTSCYVAGGVTYDYSEVISGANGRAAKFKKIIEEVGRFIIKEHVPVVLALGALYPNYDNLANANTLNTHYPVLWGLGNQDDPDLVTNPAYSATPVAANTRWGAGTGNFVAWGAFPDTTATGALALPGGIKTADGVWDLKVENKADVYADFLGGVKSGQTDGYLPVGNRSMATNLTESILNSRYDVSELDGDTIVNGKAFPGAVQRTMPAREHGYSYIKSPRWNNYSCEVGPYARMVVAGFYPVDESTPLRTGFGTWYTAYAKTASTGLLGLGLDPAMIAADLAVALVREGLANLQIGTATYGVTKSWNTVDNDISAFTDAQMTDAYTGVLGDPVIVGPVSEWVLNLVGGKSVMDRLRGRALEALYLVQQMIGVYDKGTGTFGATSWADSLKNLVDGAPTWKTPYAEVVGAVSGYGATEAPRGALAHFESVNAAGKITAYQAVVPTTWNASPKDGANATGANGPIEQAMMNIPFSATTSTFDVITAATKGAGGGSAQSGIEALRVAHTFDPCIACAIH